MYEPDSSSSSVVSSTSRSPQSQSQSSQNGNATEPGGAGAWAAKPMYEQQQQEYAYDHGKGNGAGGGSPTITTNGQDNGMLFMDHDHDGHDPGQTQLHWLTSGNGNGHGHDGMDALKKEALKAFEVSKMGPPSDRAAANGGNGEVPTTTSANGGPMQMPGPTSGPTSNSVPTSSSSSSNNSSADQPEQSSNLSSTQNSPTKTKPPKLCQVCGDKAKSFHFGGLSCDSCKAFFRRSVHNDAYKGFQCVYQRSCEITISTRKSCQACRFKKCLGIGMETNWVMTEEERNQLQKQRSEKKESGVTAFGKGTAAAAASNAGPTQNAAAPVAVEDDPELAFEPSVAEMLNYMTAEERDEIESIVNKYQHSYREIPFRVPNSSGTRKTVEIIQMFTTILRRFAYFTKLIPEFAALVHSDQSTLLRAGVLEMCLLRSALAFDMKNNRWPKTENMEFLKDCPQLRVEDMEKLVSKDLYHMHMQFINGIQELRVDEPTVMILLLIVLFYPERGPLEQQELISKVQEKYLLLLNKYVQWRFGTRAGKVFPKLLTRLADLRQLNDFHTEYNLKMTKTEVEEIQEQLGNINLNPYPQWVLVDQQQKAAVAAAAASHLGVGGMAGVGIGMHSAHAYADTSADTDGNQLSPQGLGHDSLYTPSPDAAEYSMPVQDIHMQGLPDMQQPQPQMMNYGSGHGPMAMPYAANAGAPRQFPATAAAGAGGMPQMPNMRQLFMQFVNNRIPTLITNPFAAFPMDNELSGAAAFFEQMTAAGGGAPSMQQIQSLMAGSGLGQEAGMSMASMGMGMADQQHLHTAGSGAAAGMSAQQAQHQHGPAVAGSGSQAPISQICNILESSDPDTLRQLKDCLSPGMVAKLSSIFGAGGSAAGGGAADFLSSGSFDLSKIPPELIQSFLSGGGIEGLGGGSNAAAATAGGMMSGIDLGHGSSGMSGYQQQQQYAGVAGTGYSGGGYAQHQQDQNAYQQELDLSAANWTGVGVGQAPAQVVPDQHQQAILAGGLGHAGSGAADFTSAAFLTHRQQAQQPHHSDMSPTEGPRYGNGSHW